MGHSSNDNNLTVGIGTTYDGNSMSKASQDVENYASKIEVARQRVTELSQSENVKQSTMMAAINTLGNYEQKFDAAIQKQDQESAAANEAVSSHQSLAGSLVAAQAAYQLLSGALQKTTQFFKDSLDSANNYQRAIAGINSTSRAMGDNATQATQAAQKLSTDGLIPVTQSATALRNLLASGFSLPQAIQLMDALKDKMAFNRQGYDNMGDAVVHATKGIELGNTKMLESTGVNVKLNAMLKENGVATSNLGDLQGSAAARQAIVNGVLQNAAGNYGDAAKASEIFGAKQAAAGTAIENLKIQLGGVEQMVGGPLIQAFTSFLNSHQRMIVDFGVGAVAAVALTAGIIGAGLAIQAVTTMLLAANPLMLAFAAAGMLIGALFGAVVYNAVDKLQQKFKDYNAGLGAGSDNTNELAKRTGELTQAQKDLADKLVQIDNQITKNNRDFQQSLAQTIQGIQDKISSLNQSLSDENQSFAKSQAKKLDEFNKTEESMADAHDKRIATIQKSLDKERALGKWADQTKLNDLEQQLADENDQYNQQLTDKQTTYNQDVADAKEAHDKKITDLQQQLNQEQSLIQKHAADVAAVRNVTMLDEIDKIKQAHNEQIAALDQEKQKAIESAQKTVDGVNNAYTTGLGSDTMKNQLAGIGSMMGTSMGNALKDVLTSSFTQISIKIVNFFEQVGNFLKKNVNLNPLDWFSGKAGGSSKSLSQLWDAAAPKASGGPINAGQSYLVGDNPDGSINSTTEMFVPSQSGTILSAPQTRSLLSGSGGRGGVTINQTNHIYNQVDMNAANLALGWKLVNA